MVWTPSPYIVMGGRHVNYWPETRRFIDWVMRNDTLIYVHVRVAIAGYRYHAPLTYSSLSLAAPEDSLRLARPASASPVLPWTGSIVVVPTVSTLPAARSHEPSPFRCCMFCDARTVWVSYSRYDSLEIVAALFSHH